MLTQTELTLQKSDKRTIRSVLKIGAVGLGLIAGTLLAGCKTAPATHTMASDAVQCDTCKVTWVKVPHHTGRSGVVGYSSFKQMECPDCRNMVVNFFETGNLEHTCKACSGNMTICESH
jgi:ribosomal protein S27E